MLLSRKQLVLVVSILVLSGIVSACQSTPTPANSSEPGISVEITADVCPNVMVQAGQQVTWTNQDTREHIVRDNTTKAGNLFDSGILQPGDRFAFTFPGSGTFTYECSENGSATGTVTVQP